MSAAKAKSSSNLLNDYHLLSFDEIDSTNEEAKRLAKGGGHHGAVIWAKKQTAGKGRLGRVWTSSQGNLFVSILLHPEKPMKDLAQLSFVTAVAVMEALEPLLPPGRRLQCKWPNDILLSGKKVGGILLESFQSGKASEKGKPWVVVGVGINVESFPAKTEFPATCLKDAGVELVSAKIILSRFVHHFIDCYNEWDIKGFAPCRRRWLKNAWGMKQRLKARLPDKVLEGYAEGIDLNGSLVLTLKDGKKIQVSAADIFPIEAKVEA